MESNPTAYSKADGTGKPTGPSSNQGYSRWWDLPCWCNKLKLLHKKKWLHLIKGLDREAIKPMIKELDEDREESQDPEVEFAIAGAVREWKFCWKLFRCV
ncbi:hypothetical protein LXL04_023652 [Taraxacum kok-saghyz]